jgi:threonine dehydrogenase-like Zn-dependent dehydrogenase
VIDPAGEDTVERMVELTGGTGPRIVFECAGAPPTLDQALQAVARRGQVILVAIAWEPVPVLPSDWIGREVKLQASFASLPADWEEALRLMQEGSVRVEPMLDESSFVPLEGIQAAFEALIKPSTQLQMVVRP